MTFDEMKVGLPYKESSCRVKASFFGDFYSLFLKMVLTPEGFLDFMFGLFCHEQRCLLILSLGKKNYILFLQSIFYHGQFYFTFFMDDLFISPDHSVWLTEQHRFSSYFKNRHLCFTNYVGDLQYKYCDESHRLNKFIFLEQQEFRSSEEVVGMLSDKYVTTHHVGLLCDDDPERRAILYKNIISSIIFLNIANVIYFFISLFFITLFVWVGVSIYVLLFYPYVAPYEFMTWFGMCNSFNLYIFVKLFIFIFKRSRINFVFL